MIITLLWRKSKMKVAVVDDDKKYRAEIVKLLEPYVEPYGIVTCEFEDGQAFVNVAKEKVNLL